MIFLLYMYSGKQLNSSLEPVSILVICNKIFLDFPFSPVCDSVTNNMYSLHDISRAANIYGLPVKIRFLRLLNGNSHGNIKNYGFLMLKNVRFHYVN